MKEKRVYSSEVERCMAIVQQKEAYLKNPTQKLIVLSDELTDPFQIRLTHKQFYALAEASLETKKSRNEIIRDHLSQGLFGKNSNPEFSEIEVKEILEKVVVFTDKLKELLPSNNRMIVISKDEDGNLKIESITK